MNSIMKHIRIILLICSSLFISEGIGQTVDIESIKDAKPLALNGSLTASSIFTSGLNSVNKPINYFLSGNLNFNVFNVINVPININLSDRKVSLSQGYSFNQFSVNPTYKWISVHAGTNYMSFSPYTLNGHQFLGGGVELTPDNWNIKAMYGRLRRGQSADTLSTGPTFKRMAYGLKVQYMPANYMIGLSFLKSQDFDNSLSVENRFFENRVLTPEDNLVVSLDFGTTLFHVLELSAEYSNSIITKNKSDELETSKISSLAGIFSRGNATSNSYNAFKTKINYNITRTNTLVGLGYERIDPNYRTHGGYFFNEDLINYTVNLNQTFQEGKFSLAANGGIQKDNIKNTKASEASRIIGSINANGQFSEKLTMGLNFSNFQNFMFVNDLYSQITRVPGMPIDSLDFKMISQNLGYNLNKNFRQTEDLSEAIVFNINYLTSLNKRDNVINEASKTNVLNTTLGYSLQLIPKNVTFMVGMNYFSNKLAESSISGFGPNLNIQKLFFDQKLSTSLNLTFLKTTSVGEEIESQGNSAINTSFMANYRLKEKHNFSFNTSIVKNSSINAFVNGTLSYNYSF